MNELTQYIKQRIEYYDNNRFSYEMDSQLCNCVISELQAVLSKIEEIEKWKCAKFLEEYEKRFPSSNITSDIEHKPVTREDIISKS